MLAAQYRSNNALPGFNSSPAAWKDSMDMENLKGRCTHAAQDCCSSASPGSSFSPAAAAGAAAK
jgi:hypothetical protein